MLIHGSHICCDISDDILISIKEKEAISPRVAQPQTQNNKTTEDHNSSSLKATKIGQGYRLISIEDTHDGGLVSLLQIALSQLICCRRCCGELPKG
ncbi:hypothetical protein Lal_00011955 [Lupinus albus]|nr:hypothetical protein Lal_00011955 [Lupinus albus]